MVAVIQEPNFSESTWCRKLHASLTERLREKRISYTEPTDCCPADAEAVFLLASDLAWIRNAVTQLNSGGVQPILLCNQLENIPGCLYSCVCSDVNASMKNLAESLGRQGRKRAALCGVNPSSIADLSRADALMLWKRGNLDRLEIFINDTSLDGHIRTLLPRLSEFDALICANDFVAVALLRCARQECVDLSALLPLISCTGSEISTYYAEEIQSLDLHFTQYGSAAVDLYELLQKKPYLTGVTVKLAWRFDEAAKTPRAAIPLCAPMRPDVLYRDAQFSEMLIVEKLLAQLSDPTDRAILLGLLNEESTETIAGNCYLSANAVKYRVRRMLATCGASDRHELLALLRKYLPEQALSEE